MSKMIYAVLFLVVVFFLVSHFYEGHNKAMSDCLRSHSVTTCEHTLNR